jgi:capsular exopolysaccharide synthesis family protein
MSASTTNADPREVLRTLWRRKLLFAIPFTLALLMGAAGAFLLKPIYVSSVTLILERPQQLAGQLGDIGGNFNPDAQADLMREQAKSSVFLKSVLTTTGVRNDPATRTWALKEGTRVGSMTDEQVIDEFLVDRLRKGTMVRKGKGSVFQVTVEDYDRDRAQKLAAGVADQFVMFSKNRQLQAIQATQEFSGEQQSQVKAQLEESERRLETFQRSVVNSSQISSSVGETNISRARTLYEQAQIEMDDLSGRVAQLRGRLNGRIKERDPQALTSAQTNALESQMRSLERQVAVAEVNETPMMSGTNAGASVRLSIARKHSDLEAEMLANAGRTLPTLPEDVRQDLVSYRVAQADLAAVESRRSWLQQQIRSFESNIVLGPDREIERQRLMAEVERNRTLYNSFLQQSTASQIAEAFENAKVSGRFSVLEPATRPMSPAKPNRPVLILLALIVGAVVGTGTVLLVEHHDESVKNAEEVESIIGLPVLAAIPRVEELERSRRRSRTGTGAVAGMPAPRDHGLLHRLKVESPLGLEFRRAYLKLKSRTRTLPKSLLVTSSTRGEGKTTTTACLAITMARELREKVLLVDFDLRSPALHRALGLPSSSWGLAQMLGQRHFDERFVRATVLPNLEFLPAGRSERPAAELIEDQAVDWFIQEATRRYPMVIIDSAPNLAVPDPLILGRVVEGVLYVIKAGSTVRKAAEYGVKVQRESRDNLLGVLINDAGEILPQYYGYRANYYGYASTEAGGADG